MAQKRPLKDQEYAEDVDSSPTQGEASKPDVNQDPPPSVKQITVALWFAKYKKCKNNEPPRKVLTSNRHWWKWIKETLTRIDYEDAHAAERDFKNLIVDLDDPINVIGALRYRQTATIPSPEEEATAMLLAGIHPFTVEDNLMLSQNQLDEIVKKVELSGYEIEWGSV